MKKYILFLSSVILSFNNLFADESPSYLNTDLDIDVRVEDLVNRMTLEEKISQMSYESPGIERLGIKPYVWWNECLHGVARAGKATVFPQAIGMAAMWDKDLMYEIADAISDEARAKYHDFDSRGKHGIYQGLTYWTPNINIFRDPRWGRGMETYGEDPYLTGELGTVFVKGLQGSDPKHLKLVATAKHFTAHSGPESTRHSFNVVPSDKDFKATYTPHFKKVVQEGKVYSVMCAYQRFNGMPCCGSSFLSNLLRNEWGFEGYIVSDCWAIKDFYQKGAHEIVGTKEEAAAMAVEAGTDLNCGDTYPALLKAVEDGLLDEEEIDVAVKRLLKARFLLGQFDPQENVKWSSIPMSVVESGKHIALARKAAEKSMVLLKNEGKILPLSKELKKVAVIGPNGDDLEVLLANYNGYPTSPVTPYAGIKNKLRGAEVVFEYGCPIAEGLPIFSSVPGNVLFTDSMGKNQGLTAYYYDNSELQGKPRHKVTDKNIDFDWGTNRPLHDMDYENFSVRWEGYLIPQKDGRYGLGTEAFSGSDLYLNDTLLVTRYDVHNPRKEYEYVDLKAGKPYKIRLDYKQRNTEKAMVRLLWEAPDPDMKERALKAASEAEAVILCMGISPLLEGEEMKVKVPGFSGGDRDDIRLPAIQTELIKEIMALGKPTVLVMFNGSALAFNWENENVGAIIEAWYPGQEGGNALANILFGDVNPSGKLPLTFYKSIDQIPAFDDYDMDGKTYRYFKGVPLYKFGHGLSYTDYEFEILTAPQLINSGEPVNLMVKVNNIGEMPGEAVVETYISFSELDDQPLRELKNFQRVSLRNGESKIINITLPADELKVLDENCQWVDPKGKVNITVGGRQPGTYLTDDGTIAECTVIII